MLERLSYEARWAGRDSLVMAWRNITIASRAPDLLTGVTIQPVMFVLLFVYVFGGAISTGSNLNYTDFLLPGVMVQTVLFGASLTGIGLTNDLQKGMVDRYRSLPMARSAVISGRILADTLLNIFVVFVILGVGLAIGFRFHGGLLGAIAMPILAVGFAISFSWIGALIGTTVKSVEAANVMSFMYILPLTFISSTFVPVETMPGWLQPFAENSPITVTVDAARALSQGGPVAEDLWKAIAWAIGISAIAAPIAVSRYRRVT